MGRKQAGATVGAVPAGFAATANDFAQIYAPTQGATVGSPVVLKALVKSLGGGMGATVEVTQATPGTINSPTLVGMVSFTYPNVEASVTLVTGLNILEVRLLVNGTVVATDQVIVTVSP